MRLTDVPADVLSGIVGRLDQADKVACLTACKALGAAAAGVGVWPSVTFRDLDCTAVAFMARHRCPRVVIRSDCPDDVSWFFDQLAARDIPCLEELTIELGVVQRLPYDFLTGLARQRPLRQLAVTIAHLDEPSEVVFPRSCCLFDLHALRIVDRTPGAKQLVVWFADSHARFSSLRTLHLDVAVSDALAGLKHMPSLREVVYRSDDEEGGETYEDMAVEGATLDVLELDVGAETSYHDLWHQLGQCSVRRLVLHVNDDWLDVSQPLGPALEDIELQLYTNRGDIKFDFPHLSELTRLRTIRVAFGAPWLLEDQAALAAASHHLIFAHATPAEWIRFFQPRALDLPPNSRVTMSFAM